jgi:PAS domain S-box-containing protein
VPVHFEYEHNHPGGLRWLQATVTFLGSAPTGRPRFSFVAEEFTARKRREMNLAFLDELNQDIARLSSTEEIMQTLGAKLGARLNLASYQLVDIDEENDASYIFYVWNASNVQSVYGYYRISEFLAPEFYSALHSGSVVTVSDTLHDPRTRAEAYARTNVLSFVTVPFHRSGKWKFLISCTASEVRHWRPDEIELIQEFAYRIFPRLERARAEEALRQSETRYRLLHENLRDAFVQVDMQGHILDFNDLYCQMLGYSREELGTLTYLDLTPEEWRSMESDIVRDQVIPRGFSDVYEKEYRRKDGTIFPVELRTILSRDLSGEPNGMWAIIRDITDRKHAEEALRESEKQLRVLNETLEQRVQEKTEEVRRLASDLVIAVQQERQRISHVLHDDLQQRVYALQMQLKYLRDALESRTDAIAQDVVQAERELHEILQLTRQISIDLSPPILPGEGLSHAISWLTTQLWQRYGLAVEIDAKGEFELSNEELHVLLFNCVRELLFNIVKHADVHRAFVSLQWVDEILQIEVRDQGKGFNLEDFNLPSDDPTVEASFGLPSIRHQLSLFGGHLDIKSEPGKGTNVVLTVPIAESH